MDLQNLKYKPGDLIRVYAGTREATERYVIGIVIAITRTEDNRFDNYTFLYTNNHNKTCLIQTINPDIWFLPK